MEGNTGGGGGGKQEGEEERGEVKRKNQNKVLGEGRRKRGMGDRSN